ncbi:hypothetical protein [Phreatobacter cathodiphilus]|uniref:DUF2065 domain-containing protein n=1 Tax=Phreatobacter cathodiphilus TaxID=1868589 RepID=A0A2S0NF43_9HYPH|nr:hypothetical protein [Phreatobacter cathodiphilus]AVO46687.1 hypothetical protein C6569_17360 [Phreatobacter cathodiphilus]
MLTSVYLARLIGPVMLTVGIGLLVRPAAYRAAADELAKSSALIVLSGLLMMPAGLAILLSHRVIGGDWRMLITLIGLALFVVGAWRIVAPDWAAGVARHLIVREGTLKIAAAIWLILGAILTIAGYWPQSPTP